MHILQYIGEFLCVCVCVCVSVCMSVRLYVSTVLNGSSPSLEGNLLRVMTLSVLCVCMQRAGGRVQCARINRVRLLHWRSMKPIIASGSFIVTVYWTVMSTPNGRTESLQFSGNLLLLTISVKDYLLFMFMHRAHACKRACARACVIKHSLTYEPILFKFANILQIITSSMWYIRSMFTHHVYASKRASARLVKNIHRSMDGFSSNLLGTYYRWPQVTWDIYVSCSHTAGTRTSAPVRART
jgi:hypothetical protein